MVEAAKRTVRKTRVKLKFKWTKFFRFILLLALVLLLLEMSWLFVANLLQKVVVAEWGVIEKGNWMEVVYLREEHLVTAPAEGSLTLRVKSSMRVPRDEIIATLDTEEHFFNKSPEISDASLQQYKKLQKLIREETAQHLDLQRINADIVKRSEQPGASFAGSDLENLKQEKERVLRTIQWIRPQIMQIQQELAPVLNRTKFITAVQAGYFVAETDGFETNLKPAEFDKITVDDFGRNYPSIKTGNQVKTGAVIGKLIGPFKQVIAIKVDSKQTGILRKGDVWRFKTPGGWKNASLAYIKTLNPQTAIVGVELPMTES
ncbi:MAG TPA: HlyD family efflux transporter periplasmic adaptor subunit, partial [Bacillota bacterium]|nr:HlyD family efflux transporter periplasmic adaptor subunit [Bacillota bacterium]